MFLSNSSTHTEGTQDTVGQMSFSLLVVSSYRAVDRANHVTHNVDREPVVGGQDRFHTQAHLHDDTRATYM